MNIDCSCVYFRKAECTHYKHPEKECWFLVNGKCNPKRKTNADRIRAMNDVELGNFLCATTECGSCKWHKIEGCTLTEWLKQTAEVD